jgi:hypothetical protein
MSLAQTVAGRYDTVQHKMKPLADEAESGERLSALDVGG